MVVKVILIEVTLDILGKGIWIGIFYRVNLSYLIDTIQN